eukprot:4456006-Heterocapsa_arctica.AAC.1
MLACAKNLSWSRGAFSRSNVGEPGRTADLLLQSMIARRDPSRVVGAYTDPSPKPVSEGIGGAQELATTLHNLFEKDEVSVATPGTLQSIGRQHGRWVTIARGAEEFDVPLLPCVVERD